MIGLSGVRGAVLAAVGVGALLAGGLGAGAIAAQTPAGAAQPQTISQKIAASKNLLDVNTATAAQLKALPGMGDMYVQRVVAGRPYTAKSQLATRGIVPQAEYERIKEQIIAHRVK